MPRRPTAPRRSRGRRAPASSCGPSTASAGRRTRRPPSRPTAGSSRSTPTRSSRRSSPSRFAPASPRPRRKRLRPPPIRVPIRLEFLGRELLFGRDTVVRPVRLYDRMRARFSDDPVHEKILTTGPVESLEESVLHRSYRDLAHYLEKLDRYTTLAAEAKWAAGKGARRLSARARPLGVLRPRVPAPRLPRRLGRAHVRGPLVREHASEVPQAARAGAGDRPRGAHAPRGREDRRHRDAPDPRASQGTLTATTA